MVFTERASAKETEIPSTSSDEIEKKLEAALACPCVSEYKDSPCGKQFVEAFSCFVRAPDDAKGHACVDQFLGFQSCISANWGHFERVLDKGGVGISEAVGRAVSSTEDSQKGKGTGEAAKVNA